MNLKPSSGRLLCHPARKHCKPIQQLMRPTHAMHKRQHYKYCPFIIAITIPITNITTTIIKLTYMSAPAEQRVHHQVPVSQLRLEQFEHIVRNEVFQLQSGTAKQYDGVKYISENL